MVEAAAESASAAAAVVAAAVVAAAVVAAAAVVVVGLIVAGGAQPAGTIENSHKHRYFYRTNGKLARNYIPPGVRQLK